MELHHNLMGQATNVDVVRMTSDIQLSETINLIS